MLPKTEGCAGNGKVWRKQDVRLDRRKLKSATPDLVAMTQILFRRSNTVDGAPGSRNALSIILCLNFYLLHGVSLSLLLYLGAYVQV